MPKKENYKKNYLAHKVFKEHQKENRPAQVWVWDNIEEKVGHWEHV